MKQLLFILLLLSGNAAFTVQAQDTLATGATVPDSTAIATGGKGRMAASADTGAVQQKAKTKKVPKYTIPQYQLRFLFDVGNLAVNFADARRQDYEFSADFLYKNNWYLAAEGGYALGVINYDNLKYNTNSTYLRIGADKSLLQSIGPRDYDIVFFGFRYGMGFGNRGTADYVVPSQFGPSQAGTLPDQNFWIHWGEMTGGIRVEMWRGIYAGWNFRARFLLNGKTFENKLTPNYIAGYGNADNSTSFGFNVYLGYAFRWKP